MKIKAELQKEFLSKSAHSLPAPPNKMKKFFEDWGFIAFFAIFTRKIEQTAAALSQLNPAPFKITDPKLLQGIQVTQLGLYGFQTLLSTIVASIKIYNLWSESGPYARKVALGKNSKTLLQKIRSTTFTAGMTLSDISLFGVTIAFLQGSITYASPLAITLVGINASINIVKYLWSIGRELRASHNGHHNSWRLFDKCLKLIMASMMAIGLMSLLFVPAPFTFIAASGTFMLWAAARITHYFVKFHSLRALVKQRDVELKLLPNTAQITPHLQGISPPQLRAHLKAEPHAHRTMPDVIIQTANCQFTSTPIFKTIKKSQRAIQSIAEQAKSIEIHL